MIVGMVGCGALASAEVIYSNDFENPVDNEWSVTTRCHTPGGSRPATWFLGGHKSGYELGFDADTVSLSLGDIGIHSWIEINFDLFIINSWDGNGNGSQGPDYWRFGVAGQPLLLDTTFSMVGFPQAYPGNVGSSHPYLTGALEVQSLGMNFPNTFGDSVYRITRRFAHSASSIQFNFAGAVDEPNGQNETWGIDNVVLEADIVPEPSSVLAFLTGIGGIAGGLLRRRH